MNLFNVLAILLTAAALASFVNDRYIGLPTTVGLMLMSLVGSLLLMLAGQAGLPLKTFVESVLTQVDFSHALLDGALSFLLFAGALHVDWDELRHQRWRVGSLAVGSTVLSTVLVAALAWAIFRCLGLAVPLLYCLLFGAIISPTDPIAVVEMLQRARAPISISTKIAGESLFNDGIGVVLFLVFSEPLIEGHGAHLDWARAGTLLVREAGGGIAFGLLLGGVAYLLIKRVDNYQVEVLLTLAMVSGGYALAQAVQVSGPLAIVAAGILIGNLGRNLGMSEGTRANLDLFWELIDGILNALLFVVIGLEVLVLRFHPRHLAAALLFIPAVLLARVLSVGAPAALLRLFRRDIEHGALALLTWGGLRGGISIALALALPAGNERDLLLMATYTVVAFSILVQGTTMPWLLKWVLPGTPDGDNGQAKGSTP